ncbi:leucyl-tRNA synthetase [Actinobaculum suis]|uniref:Leucine--tRNA ligase n=1 Tax=Actinobaculum suis TaxID=1657 RepID=A0A1G7E6Z3_9ACTO|nr:class I tRNA ligase family protein [Actinobaculum suis]MDY5153217.1 class I tRNA ligase family protein [Actinobaculum suis]SDE59462.1 leucyl-tRNA synthetase [Actinobaculum suis]VDG76336.1 leucyl-tRNA synthetase [Actinobaculum suis]
MSAESGTPYRYTAELANEIEARWQERWQQEGTFNADNPVGNLAGEHAQLPKYYIADMFPYPSGKGLHVGHPLGYIATDCVARYQRMQGKNVLYTMGYDAFGLPAEQYAVQTGQHPRITTEENVANMRGQLARLGLSHDLRRSFSTTDIDYVKWTQWIFLQVYNSWFDPEAPRRDGRGTGAARPISELVAQFEKGEKTPANGQPWANLTAAEKEAELAEYRLAYVAEAPVNWCPGLGTVLANEEVTAEGRSERGNYPVFKRNLKQWMMRITAYADRLIDDLDTIDWPEKVRAMQVNWIGRSEGATVRFTVTGGGTTPELDVYTTRPDTLFGATFMAVAPEHKVLGGTAPGASGDAAALAVPDTWPEGTRSEWTGGAASPREAVRAYRAQAASKSDTERTADEHEKTGVFSGLYGINPVNGAQVPIFVADYVLTGYGTGAIMAVPAHDDRDWEFAQKYNLDVVRTIGPEDDPYGPDLSAGAYTGDGVAVDSENAEVSLNGLGKDAAKARMTQWLTERGTGKATVNYRLRDWLFSRQRYWGEPFPIVWDEEGVPHALPASQLPVELPELSDYSPVSYDPDDADSQPKAPLSKATDWVNVELDLGDGRGLRKYRRETNTMPQWAGSCWYELRYTDPENPDAFADPENENYWMGPRPENGNVSGGVDLYVGGVEHAVLHLLYARFWHKVLYDLGYVSSSEPFHKLFNQGYIQAYAYTDARGQYVPAQDVEEKTAADGTTEYFYQGKPVTREYGKMGKSLKNIVTPESVSDEYGTDTFRVYEMSMGPLDESRPWETRAIVGSQRFLQRLWRNVVDETTGEVTVVDTEPDAQTAKLLARTIAGVTEDYDAMRTNTAISKLIVLNNHLTGLPQVPRAAAEALVLMVSPVAPHIAEELWEKLGRTESLARHPFPQVSDESLLEDDLVTCVIQVQGKVRARIEVRPDIAAEELEKLALAEDKVQKYLDGEPRKVIVRAPNIVNVVP